MKRRNRRIFLRSKFRHNPGLITTPPVAYVNGSENQQRPAHRQIVLPAGELQYSTRIKSLALKTANVGGEIR